MKKVLLTIIVLALSFEGFAQIVKGANTISVNLSCYSNTTKYSDSDSKNNSFNFSFNPRYGYLVSDNIEIGLGVGYGYSKYKNDNPSASYFFESNENVFSVLPYMKWYQGISEHFYFILTAMPKVGFGTSKQVNISGSTTSTTESSILEYGINIWPGFTYLFNNHWSIDLGLGALSVQSQTLEDKETKVKTTDTNIQFYGSFASGLSLGASYYF